MFLKKTVTFLFTLFSGIFAFAYYFIPHKQMQLFWDVTSDWATILTASATIVGAVSMFRTYFKKAASRSDPNRYYAMVSLVALLTMTVIGLVGGITPHTLFNDIFLNIMSPLESTMFSLLAFYIASAAFRSFRLKSLSAGLLLTSAIVVMLAQIPTGELIWNKLPLIKDWILDYPNVAAQRAILMGVAIGAVATALKIILGIDKSIISGGGK